MFHKYLSPTYFQMFSRSLDDLRLKTGNGFSTMSVLNELMGCTYTQISQTKKNSIMYQHESTNEAWWTPDMLMMKTALLAGT